ncbi:MAG: hypothetical protein ACRDWH_08110, partial [Acidimicrobiia bacterium]
MTLLPVSAAQGNDPTGDLVEPTVISHFGGLDDCDDPAVGTVATHSLRIPAPATGTFIDQDTGVEIGIVVNGGQRTFNFSVHTAGWVVYDVTVKGGTDTNWYDYFASSVGVQTSDTSLHSPPKGNRYDNLSHITFCYDTPPLTISGTKVHDRDSDGLFDANEEGLDGWTIKAFNGTTEVASGLTDADGDYELAVGPGTFTVCEVVKTEPAPFSWGQTFPTGAGAADCSSVGSGLEPAGHSVTLTNTSVTGIDFGNVRGVT